MPVRVKTEEPEPVQSHTEGHSDDVVREIDVYLSPELCHQIHLLQYPLQNSQVGAVTEARIKPRHGLIEIDQPLPQLPQRHYGVGEQNMSYVNKRTFRSHTIPVETHMCLAKMKEENGTTALHLVPLQHISQMRPSFHHIDADQNDDNADTDDLDKMDDDQEKKPLMFKRKESERASNARKSSYAYKKASEDAEEWQALQICEEGSMEYHKASDMVACPNRQQDVLVSPDPTKRRPKYIETLNYMPMMKNDPTLGMTGGTDVKSVLARVTTLLRNGWPMPYSVVRGRFSSEVDDDTIFRALSVCAVMVRGNFCLHSRFLALSPTLQHARTFVLHLLQTKGSIQRERLQLIFQSSSEVTDDKLHVLLNQVAKRSAKGWELRVDDDLAFVALHPEQSELHLKYWEKQNQSGYFMTLLQKYEDA